MRIVYGKTFPQMTRVCRSHEVKKHKFPVAHLEVDNYRDDPSDGSTDKVHALLVQTVYVNTLSEHLIGDEEASCRHYKSVET